MKKIVLLGASGSIGSQTIDVIVSHPEEFDLVAFSVGHNINKVHEILEKFPMIQHIGVADEKDAIELKKQYASIEFYFGDKGLCQLANLDGYDTFISAIVGFRGLEPLLEAIKKVKYIALANKESLVAGGPLIKKALNDYNVMLLPIDSEHSAILQCLQGNNISEIDRLIVTASGGSFRDKTRAELTNVTKEQALKHPNWKMGGRITIDSATMANKGFEVIEAHYLFDIPFDKIEVVIHSESVVHSLVQYRDHSVIAQMGSADMKIPIQYALSYPRRLKMYGDKPFNFMDYPELHFQIPDFERFPLLALAYEVGKKGGNLGAIMNGADEEAVSLFLEDKIKFLEIEDYVIQAVRQCRFIENPSLEELIASDLDSREFVRQMYEARETVK
ncbi:1-deoxy-D-xylulose-5-phosphate reductoisomerase [Anaerorhabdus furcosa]|uniref:1-deoxy-D-xylulose 5-phosphate reductoisomerase n=1 Tax=Anaerorhabdus furcosa TaxID=118967 RepID=A0A1T4P1I1_9FIRM|nr:1-deoxy-D-xylulose-5-phosphate reductoisomerase [Anaerorhabdus furcosa]SJZ85252.1 1-deoxy-D-xylulose 5-phosphate reductoisomerase [Anaerorhabdus furcosa]